MKKIYLFLATLCLTFFYSLSASGNFLEQDGIRFFLDNETGFVGHAWPTADLVAVISWKDKNKENYSHLSGDVYIPSTLYVAFNPVGKVEVISNNAFAEMRPFVNITLPHTIKEIWGNAFKNATGLRKIYLNEGLTTLETNVFRGCYNLTSVNIPSTLKGIPNYTFEGCRSLSAINVAFVDTIGAHAFENCTALQSVSSSSTNFINFIWARRIGACAFSNCVNLQQIKFGV